jgi:hypothetical protein
MLGDLGGAASISMVRIGDSLGLYRALHSKGSMTCRELSQETGVHDRYLRERLSHQAASNYLSYDPAIQKFSLPPEQAMVFAIEDSPVYMMGAFDLMTWMIESKDQIRSRRCSRRAAACRGAITRVASSARSRVFFAPVTRTI